MSEINEASTDSGANSLREALIGWETHIRANCGTASFTTKSKGPAFVATEAEGVALLVVWATTGVVG